MSQRPPFKVTSSHGRKSSREEFLELSLSPSLPSLLHMYAHTHAHMRNNISLDEYRIVFFVLFSPGNIVGIGKNLGFSLKGKPYFPVWTALKFY